MRRTVTSSPLGLVPDGGPGRQLDVVNRLSLGPETAFERRRPASERLASRVVAGGRVGPKISEVAARVKASGDLSAERRQGSLRFDVPTAHAGRGADPGGVVGEPARCRSAEHRADRLVISGVIRLDRHRPAGPEQRVYRREERLTDQPAVAVDRVRVKDPDAGQL